MRSAGIRGLGLLLALGWATLQAQTTAPFEGMTVPQASPYVPLDHWAYEVAERLAARGIIQSDLSGSRPWSREEFRRLVEEGTEYLAEPGADGWAKPLIQALSQEFGPEEREGLAIESVYVGTRIIQGQPLTDGFHFGQTFSNDFGRPFREGFNSVVGVSGTAQKGRFAVHLRGEFQQAPEGAALPLAARQAISAADLTPLQAGGNPPAIRRLMLLDAYGVMRVKDWQVSFGQHSTWWGHAKTGSLALSNNAAPLLGLRITQAVPQRLPWILRYMGPVRTELFFGRVSGHRFVRTTRGLFGPVLERQPLIHGQRISFKPTPNLELGFSVTTMFGGPGVPFTLRTVLRSFSLSNTVPGEPNDPGDRRSGFDFRYRIPWLRDWLTIYNDSLAEDELSPVAFPRRSAMNPGILLARIPGVQRADLRVEGFYTDLPNLRGTGIFYFNTRFRSGFTNRGELLGHPVGRQGQGTYYAARYWFDPATLIRVAFKDQNFSTRFIAGGGRVQTLDVGGSVLLRPTLQLEASTQWERWKVPVLAPGRSTDVSGTLRLTYRPRAK